MLIAPLNLSPARFHEELEVDLHALDTGLDIVMREDRAVGCLHLRFARQGHERNRWKMVVMTDGRCLINGTAMPMGAFHDLVTQIVRNGED